MEINNPQVFDHIIGANGNVLRVKILEIGPWNMDTDNGVYVTHGLAMANMRSLTGTIINDIEANIYPLATLDVMKAGVMQAGIETISAATILVTRTVDGFFDSLAFDDDVMNRGWITIWYVD